VHVPRSHDVMTLVMRPPRDEQMALRPHFTLRDMVLRDYGVMRDPVPACRHKIARIHVLGAPSQAFVSLGGVRCVVLEHRNVDIHAG
jgi:hypothetical protein